MNETFNKKKSSSRLRTSAEASSPRRTTAPRPSRWRRATISTIIDQVRQRGWKSKTRRDRHGNEHMHHFLKNFDSVKQIISFSVLYCFISFYRQSLLESSSKFHFSCIKLLSLGMQNWARRSDRRSCSQTRQQIWCRRQPWPRSRPEIRIQIRGSIWLRIWSTPWSR